MGFGSNEKQQRLSFTSQTFDKIQFDMEIFEEPKFATFINKIICNYYPYAKSSIELRLDSEREKLIKILESVSPKSTANKVSSDARNVMISAMLADKKQELYTYKDGLLSGKKTESKKIYLSSDALDYLTDSCCQEVKHFSRREYIECLIEEFINLSLPEKEYFYYIDRVHTITEAINGGYQLKIKTKSGNTRYIKPYKLDSNNNSSNYLIGYIILDDISEFREYGVSYRISALSDIKPIRSKSGRITKDQRKSLDKKLATTGPQFLSQESEQVVVRFHEDGFKRYLRTSHLRPQYDKNSPKSDSENGIYVFNCTPIQAEYYFLKLGASVEIMEPLYLRKKFAQNYFNGSKIYGDKK